MKKGTRERVIEAAAFLFWRRGYRATSIAEVCREADVRPGSVYYFFAGKEDLLAAVLEMYRDGIYAGLLEPVWTATDDPLERIFGLLDVYRSNLLDTEFTYGCPIGNLALEIADPPDRVRALIAENFDAWKAAVAKCLEAGRERFQPGVDFAGVSAFVLTTMEGAVMQARAHRSIQPFDASIAALRSYIDSLAGSDGGHA